jgi:hypothetical protein
MLTNWRLIISMGIDAIPAISISKPYLDIVMTRKPGIKVNARHIGNLIDAQGGVSHLTTLTLYAGMTISPPYLRNR